MGGNSFRQSLGIIGKRLEKSEYFDLADRIFLELDDLFEKSHLVRAFYEKETHGDQDFLVTKIWNPEIPLKKQLIEKFNLEEKFLHQNSNVYSLLIDNFQVDISLIGEKYFESAGFYMDDSPAGNLVGKIYHKFGASYGYDGLYFTLRDNFNTYKLGSIQISTNNEKICEFLGLDYQQKVAGFDTEKQIFDWVIDSKFFDHRIFAWNAMNHRARVRDKKRPDYNRFLNYVNEKFLDRKYDFPVKYDDIEILNDFFSEAELVKNIEILREKELKRQESAKKFNGDLIRNWIPGLEGKNLGKAISEFKFSRGCMSDCKTFENYLEFTPADKIKGDFLRWVKNSKVYNFSELNS